MSRFQYLHCGRLSRVEARYRQDKTSWSVQKALKIKVSIHTYKTNYLIFKVIGGLSSRSRVSIFCLFSSLRLSFFCRFLSALAAACSGVNSPTEYNIRELYWQNYKQGEIGWPWAWVIPLPLSFFFLRFSSSFTFAGVFLRFGDGVSTSSSASWRSIIVAWREREAACRRFRLPEGLGS